MKKLSGLIGWIFILSLFISPNIYAYGEKDKNWQLEQKKYREQTQGAKRITVQQAYYIYKSGKAILISVDPEGIYSRRRIIGSIRIDYDMIKRSNFKLKIPKNTPILVYCR